MKKEWLLSLLVVSELYGIPMDPLQVFHELNITEADDVSPQEMLKIAKFIGYRAKVRQFKLILSNRYPMPCLLVDDNGNYYVLIQASADQVLVYFPKEERPKTLTLKELDALDIKIVILLKHQLIKQKQEKFGIKWFLPVLSKFKYLLIEVMLASFFIQLFGISVPIFIQVVIDKVLSHNSLATLTVLGTGLLVSFILEMMLSVAKNHVFSNTTNKIDMLLSVRLYEHLLRLPLRYFENRRVGDTVARIRELETIRNFLTGTPLNAILDCFFLILYIVILCFYSMSLTWIVILTIPLFVILSIVTTPLFKQRLEERFATGAKAQSFLVESVSGVHTIKSLALEPKMREQWGELEAGYTKASFKGAILSGDISAIGQFIQKVSDLLILWLGAKAVLDGKLTVGQLIAFRMLASKVSGPILRIVQIWQDVQQTSVSIDRIGDIFNSKIESSSENKTRMQALKGDIKFQQVSSRYDSHRSPAIKEMSFEIPAGKTVGIVGRSGSGKSTLTKLIQSLYVPESGDIFIDGVNISVTDTVWLRSQIGVVLQENFLFNRTIRENIAINYPSASIEAVIDAAKAAGAHEFIASFPNGYDTEVGEQGVGLSGGQKQRVAIARALMTNPKILIFDEATSALDVESEQVIQKNLKKIAENRTVLIIAHRLTTIKDADMIFALEDGELKEVGSIDELLAQPNGIFKSLYDQQENMLKGTS